MKVIGTGAILLVALWTFALQRSTFAPSAVPSIVAACMVATTVVALRLLIDRSDVRVHRGWVAGSAGAAFAIGLVALGSMSLEEHLQLALLCVASSLLALSTSPRTDAWSAAIAVLLVLLAMPVLQEHQRTTMTAAAVAAVTFWCFATRSTTERFSARQIASGVSLAATMALVVFVAERVIRPSDGNPSYAAFVPASGGDDAGSDSARSGVGEGPDEIGGNSPDSIGFDNTDTFSESGRDGLYDLWLESFGEPLKPEETKKMVGLKPQDVRLTSANDQENLRVGRKFQMHRDRPAAAGRQRDDAASPAAVMLKGPLPAYVPLTVFDSFDGQSWSEEPLARQIVPVRKLPDSNWMEILLRPLSPAFDGEQKYEVRIGSLGGRVLPLPTHVERLRMGRVARPEFFQSTRWGGIELAKRDVPAGAVIDVICKRVDPDDVVRVEPAQVGRSKLNHLDASILSPHARQLADDWARGPKRGWRQILQVVSNLRSHAEHDASRAVPLDVDPIDDLLTSKRGTSYQFASAAVLMLRSVGYPTRLASGFYASESDRDSRSGYAMLDAGQTHFWCEVSLADGTWITVDATPGYPLLDPPGATYERFADLGSNLLATARDNWPVSMGVAFVAGIAWLARRRVADGVVTLWYRLRGCTPTRVLRVLEIRARLAGAPRPAGTPVARWLRSVDQSEPVSEFVRALDRALYGDGAPAPLIARQAMRTLTLKKFFARSRGNDE